MNHEEHNTVTVPGKSFSIRAGARPRGDDGVNLTQSTAICDFQQVKDLLSDKPLRQPNRTRPIE